MYCGYVTTIKELRPHSNADRLQCATVFGSNVIVDMKTKIGDKVMYFPVDGQLSEEFCKDNNLLRKMDENGKNIGGFLDEKKRNIKALKLRGEISDGIVFPISVFSKYIDVDELRDGDQITTLGGHEICRKYIPESKPQKTRTPGLSPKKKEKRDSVSYPTFHEHADTEQLAFNQGAFRPGDTLYITLKMHGTSGRTGHMLRKKTKPNGLLRNLLRLPPKTKEEYAVVSGTRRIVLNDATIDMDEGIRKKYHDFFSSKLPKGMTVYYEIVGYVNESKPIMGACDNKKIDDCEFAKKYGEKTIFSYGCEPGENKCYVYRMTFCNDEGFEVEIPWEEVKRLCDMMGVEHVPEFDKFMFTTWEDLMQRVEKYYEGEDPIGKTHIREGVVVRIDNRPNFKAFKHKGFLFKRLEGIIKDNETAPDMEEAQEILDIRQATEEIPT